MKDLFDTADLATTYGSAIFAEHVPAETAEAVARLEGAGYANVGKTNLHEFAYGVTSENPHFGWVPNPIASDRIAGGSSGGSAAALAAGLADAALGTDSGGSIRIPAACCGVVGLKPTYGLVPLDGCFPLAPSFDHAGPMARDVAGCAAMLAVYTDIGGGVTRHTPNVAVAWTDGADPLVRTRVEAVAALLDATPVDFPFPGDTYPLFMREVADVHRELYAEHADLYGEDVARKIERCLAVSDAEVDAARRARDDYRRRADEALGGYDALVTPTLASVAPEAGIGDEVLRERLIRFTYPFNALGWPALALPCGPAEDGLPASAQLVMRPDEDAALLEVAARLEASLV